MGQFFERNVSFGDLGELLPRQVIFIAYHDGAGVVVDGSHHLVDGSGQSVPEVYFIGDGGAGGDLAGGRGVLAEEVEPLPCPVGVFGVLAHDMALDMDGHNESLVW